MTRDNASQKGPTRREYVKFGGTVVAGSLLAGCMGESGSNDGGENNGSGTEESTNASGTDENESYTVEMAPVGELEFDAPPERVTTYFPGYADMCVALNVGDSLIAMAEMARYHTYYYDELDGVDIDLEGLTEILGDSGIDKEVFYELNSDLHLIDPEWLINNEFFRLDESDIEEIEQNIAPFFGNTIFRQTDEWHDYRYYTLYEAFEKVA